MCMSLLMDLPLCSSHRVMVVATYQLSLSVDKQPLKRDQHVESVLKTGGFVNQYDI